MIDFDQVDEYEDLRTKDFAGFADFFLQRFSQESQSDDEIDIELYTKLVELDTRLGTTATEQLFACLVQTMRLDIIKVLIQQKVQRISIISDN